MSRNRLRTLLREKKPAFGAIVTMPGAPGAQVLANAGLDWIVVDLEHGAIDHSTAHAMIAATGGTPCTPLVRIADNQPHLAKTPMDLGAFGINFPMICSAEDATRAVRSMRYPPQGERMWGPFLAPSRWGMTMPDYMAAANDEMVCVITIEHARAVERIDEIMAVPGIDAAVIGTGDLAMSIGKPGQFDDDEFLALVRRAEEGILKSGVALGAPVRSAEQANAMIERGYLMIALGFDWLLLQRGVAAAFQGIRR